MYEFGARKVVVTGLSPLGCCPSQIAKYNLTGECIGFLNDVSKQYNAALMTMLLEKREKLKDFHLVYRNLYDILTEPIASPAMYGELFYLVLQKKKNISENWLKTLVHGQALCDDSPEFVVHQVSTSQTLPAAELVGLTASLSARHFSFPATIRRFISFSTTTTPPIQ